MAPEVVFAMQQAGNDVGAVCKLDIRSAIPNPIPDMN